MEESRGKEWSVYIVRCADATLYTGVSNRLEERIKAHNLGLGAAYTRSRCPVTLVLREDVGTHSDALKREAEIKKMDRAAKLNLIENMG
jgi:predicted GIY-YIG superfamily endonuclease